MPETLIMINCKETVTLKVDTNHKAEILTGAPSYISHIILGYLVHWGKNFNQVRSENRWILSSCFDIRHKTLIVSKRSSKGTTDTERVYILKTLTMHKFRCNQTHACFCKDH